MKRCVLRFACLVAFAALLAASMLALGDMRRAWDSWVSPVESESAADIRLAAGTMKGLDWAAYAQSAYQALGAEEYPGKSVKAPILKFTGNPEVIAFFPLSSGRLPAAGEAGVCAVDRATAFALWNSLDVTGRRLVCEKKTYNVVGVLDVSQRLALLPARGGDGLDRLAVRSADGYVALTALENALGQTPETFVLGDSELTKALLFACAVPGWILLLYGLSRLKRCGGVFRLTGNGLAACAALALLLWAVACVPVRLLPGRWADFSFYVEQLRAWQAREPRLAGARDLMRTAGAARVLVLNALACLAIVGERLCAGCERSRG
jgi:hypothetical protein